jgi:hypothetical protein
MQLLSERSEYSRIPADIGKLNSRIQLLRPMWFSSPTSSCGCLTHCPSRKLNQGLLGETVRSMHTPLKSELFSCRVTSVVLGHDPTD